MKRKSWIITLGILSIIFCVAMYKRNTGKLPVENRVDPNYQIVLKQSQDNRYFISGKREDGRQFTIALQPVEYCKLNEVNYVDLTGDGKPELCIGLQYANNIVSDFNATYVYDTLSLTQLFPTQNIPIVYDSSLVNINEKEFPKHGIKFESYSKNRSTTLPSDQRIYAWSKGTLTVEKYIEKLICSDDNIGVFIENYYPYNRDAKMKISIFNFQSDKEADYDKAMQDITIDVGQYTKNPSGVVEMIDNGGLIKLEDKNGDGHKDIEILLSDISNAKNITFYWDVQRHLWLQPRDE